MASCKNCIHSGFCYLTIRDEGSPCEFVDNTKLVEVVRCKDCKYRHDSCFAGNGNIYCDMKRVYFPLHGYCSYGERKEN